MTNRSLLDPFVLLPSLVFLVLSGWRFLPVNGTYRYYFEYLPYGTGDNILSTLHMHGGTKDPHQKWLVECSDGEAMVGLRDIADDFGRLDGAWCKYLFPYKPPTSGTYPYYDTCHVKNFSFDFFCFDRQNSSRTLNTFVTGIWDNEFSWGTLRPGTTESIASDFSNPMKCCTVPKGYYIDYVSCYYAPSHDPYWEYYDSAFQFNLACGTGYVITGISKKFYPYWHEWYIDWLQCCRVGYGAPQAVSPPVTYNKNGMPTFYASSPTPQLTNPFYSAAPRSSQSGQPRSTDLYWNATDMLASKFDELGTMRYQDGPIPKRLSGKEHTFQGVTGFHDPRDAIMRTDLR